MNVEVRHLRAVVALAGAESFTVAAAMLGTTQPTLSRTIAQLEEILETRLVARTTRELELTRAGRRFVDFARELLERLDDTVADLREAEPAPLRLGWAWAGFGRHTVPLLKRWKREHAEPLEYSRPADPLRALRDGAVDAAVLRSSPPAAAPADLRTTRLFTERLVAAVSADDVRAQSGSVRLADLASGAVAVCATAPTATARLWDDADTAPRTITVANTDEWLTRIAVGEAVGVTAEATTHDHQSPEVVYLPIEDAPPVAVDLVWPAEDAHAQAGAFAAFAGAYFRELIGASTPPLVLSDETLPAR